MQLLNGEAGEGSYHAAAGSKQQQQQQQGVGKDMGHGLRNGNGGVADSGWSVRQLQQLRGRLADLVAREGLPGALGQVDPDRGT